MGLAEALCRRWALDSWNNLLPACFPVLSDPFAWSIFLGGPLEQSFDVVTYWKVTFVFLWLIGWRQNSAWDCKALWLGLDLGSGFLVLLFNLWNTSILFSELFSQPGHPSRLTSSVKMFSFSFPQSLKPSLNCMLSQSELFPWLSIPVDWGYIKAGPLFYNFWL